MITLKGLRELEKKMRQELGYQVSCITVEIWYDEENGERKRINYWNGDNLSPNFNTVVELKGWFTKEMQMRKEVQNGNGSSSNNN